MHQLSQRWALTMSVIVAVEGVLALVIGAFVAPIPQQASASQLLTAIFVRGLLAIIALVAALALAYFTGYRIQNAFEPTPATPSPAVANSPLVALFTTPGPRRDALYSGALILAVYWFFTTLYIAALGRTIGGVGLTGDIGSFIFSHLVQGLALVAGGAGAGALGARNAATRILTRRIFAPAAPVESALAPAQAQQPMAPSDGAARAAENE